MPRIQIRLMPSNMSDMNTMQILRPVRFRTFNCPLTNSLVEQCIFYLIDFVGFMIEHSRGIVMVPVFTNKNYRIMRTQDSIPTPNDEKGFYCNYKVPLSKFNSDYN